MRATEFLLPMCSQVLQEQFDDKCVALAASKESIGELQVKIRLLCTKVEVLIMLTFQGNVG